MHSFRLKWQDVPIIILVVLITGLFIFGTFHYTDTRFRSEYLQETRRLANSIDPEQLAALSGGLADLNNPAHAKLEQHLMLIRQTFPKYRSLYLMSRNPDGSFTHFTDSGSPPRLTTPEIPSDFMSAIFLGEPVILGPETDQWGKWIHVLVPISAGQGDAISVVFGMDIDADNWNSYALRSMLTPVLLAIVLAFTSLFTMALLNERIVLPDHPKVTLFRQYLEGISIFMIGLILTCIIAWFGNQNEVHSNQETFERLAAAKFGHISTRMRSLEKTEIEGLVQLFNASVEVDRQEFDTYTKHLIADALVQPWAYIPEVPAGRREQFETTVRENVSWGFEIWEEDDGRRIPARERKHYYPVLYYKSAEGNDHTLGFDFGSDPARRSGIEAAAHAATSIATDPISVQGGSTASSHVLVFTPVSHKAQFHPNGYLLATLNLDALLNASPEKNSGPKSAVYLDILQLRPDLPPLSLASNAPESIQENHIIIGLQEHPGTQSTSIQLFQAFGKTYAVAAHPSDQFNTLYPSVAQQTYLVLGMLLTLMAASLTNQITNRRDKLERLVNERTVKLKESETRLSTLIDNLPGFSYRCANDPDFTMEFITEGCKEITGYAPVDIINSQTISYNSIIHADYQENIWGKWQAILERKEAFEGEYPIITAGGDTRWVWERGQGIFSDAGELLYLEGFITDITERKLAVEQLFAAQLELQKMLDGANLSRRMLLSVIEDQNLAEEALRNVKEFNESIVQSMSDAIAIINREGSITFANPALARLLGCTIDDIIGQNWMIFISSEQAELAQAINEQGIGDSDSRLELTLLLKDGELRSVLVNSSHLADPKTSEHLATLAVLTDITERKQVENTLAEERNLLLSLMDNTPDLIYFKDLESRYLRVNKAYARYMRMADPSDLCGKSDFDFYSERYAFEGYRDEQDIIETGKPIVGKEEHETWTDGRSVWMSTTKLPHFNKKGEIAGTFGISRDISERKQIEEEIRSRNLELSTLYELSRELAVADNLNQILEVVNRHAVESIQITVARVALLEGDQLVVRAAHPIRVMDQDLAVGNRMPITALPHCLHVLHDHEPLTLTSSDEGILSNERSILLLDTTHSSCLIPLRVGDTGYNSGHTLGLLILNEARRRDDHTFTPEKIRLASSIGDQAATAIRRMRLHDDTQRHLRFLTALSEIDHTITSSFDLSFSLETVLFQVKTQLNVDAACVRLISPETRMLHIASELGFRRSPRPPSYIRLGADYAGRIVVERRSIYVASLSEEDSSADLLNDMQGEDFISYFGIPLVAKGQVQGVLEVFHRTRLEPEEEWIDFLKALAEQTAIAIDNATMFDHLQRSNAELTLAYNDTIEGLSRALDLRDQKTEGHSRRVTQLSQRIALLFNMGHDELLQMRWGALMHDIGKIAIPDHILFKSGPLSEEEWGIMQCHPVLAFEMLSPIRFLRNALDIPYCHHEMWDGSGYPRGLQGEQIPLAARIFTIADVWDALLSDRPYRPAWTKDQARSYLLEKAGSLFDPKIVKACFDARIFDDGVIDEISAR